MTEQTTTLGIGSLDVSAIDIRNLEQSGIFDANAYSAATKLSCGVNPVEHYLRDGWLKGYEPSVHFDGAWLHPYYRSVGLDGPPALIYITLRAAGWPVYATQGQLTPVIESIRNSGLFDSTWYKTRVPNIGGLDPVVHYVLVGERAQYAPSAAFDPAYYMDRHPDLARDGLNGLAHYILSGRQEGRRPVSVADELTFDLSKLDPSRETILLLIHQASRTGAPILAYNLSLRLRKRYNVIGLLLFGGELASDFADACSAILGPLTYKDWSQTEGQYLARRLLSSCQISYVIANSIETRHFIQPFAAALVPVITLVHEFASYWPDDAFECGLDWSTKVVFSAEMTAEAARVKYPVLSNRAFHVLPQGPSHLPRRERASLEREAKWLRQAMRPAGHEDAFLVLGCGFITPRKGVDIFLACAAAVRRLQSSRPIRFVWIGALGHDHESKKYELALHKQIVRSGIENIVSILNEVQDLDPAYIAADAFFISSRLDPLPNVAIDAALHGLPIICFENTTGFAEHLGNNPATRQGIIQSLDHQAAANLIVQLAESKTTLEEMSRATKLMAQTIFDMDRYVDEIDTIGRDAVQTMAQRAGDLETIDADPAFDPVSYEGFEAMSKTRRDAIINYLTRSAAYLTSREPTAIFYNRRPCSGFHPQTYAHEHADKFDIRIVNPLAHFIRSGRPGGPWNSDVINPMLLDLDALSGSPAKIALHGHFHYPEFIEDILLKLEINRSHCDLLLSATDERKVQFLQQATQEYRHGNVIIRLVPNRGRDIGSFLTAFNDILNDYDVVGHVHGKRSLSLGDTAIGERWREFLWQHLVGDLYPMVDIVVSHFALDAACGLIFPEDPHLADWDLNLEIAGDLAKRIGFEGSLPPFFDFPVGTMFWARPPALRPLLDLEMNWSDYPPEPLPIDGTILHAIERMLPFVARHAGFRYAMTHLPGITW